MELEEEDAGDRECGDRLLVRLITGSGTNGHGSKSVSKFIETYLPFTVNISYK